MLTEILEPAAVLAQTGSGQMSTFFQSGLGAQIQGIARFIAVIVVLLGFARAGKDLLSARAGAAARSIVGGLLLGALLFNLTILGTLLDAAISFAGNLVTWIGTAFGGGGNP